MSAALAGVLLDCSHRSIVDRETDAKCSWRPVNVPRRTQPRCG